MTCSHAIVFLASFSEISFASEDISVMNSTQHSIRRSRASLPKATPADWGRISETIFWTVAVRRELVRFHLTYVDMVNRISGIEM